MGSTELGAGGLSPPPTLTTINPTAPTSILPTVGISTPTMSATVIPAPPTPCPTAGTLSTNAGVALPGLPATSGTGTPSSGSC